MMRSSDRNVLSMPEHVSGGMHYQRLQPASMVGDHYDSTLNKPTFIWAGKSAGEKLDFLAFKQGAGAPTYAKAYLREFASRLTISTGAIDQARLVFVHDDGEGPVIVRYQQVVDGYDVVNRQLNVVMNQDLKLVAISGYFASTKGEATEAAGSAFGAGPQSAINTAFADLKLPVSAFKLSQTPERSGQFMQFAAPSSAQQAAGPKLAAPVGVKQVLYPLDGKLVPAWLMLVQAQRGDQNGIGYAYVTTADGSRVLFRKNMVDSAEYTYRVFADATTAKPDDNPIGNGMMPFAGPVPGTPGAGTLVTVDATHGLKDPWLPIPNGGGFNQFPTYQTIGNNVWAYLDVAGEDGRDNPADIPASTTSANTFDHALDFTMQPWQADNAEAAVVSLFYIDNWLHDAWYEAGFNEAAGNSQYVNYGRGGYGGDPLLAEAQDNSGMDNANMLTLPDGYSPRQQMYLWTGEVLSKSFVLTSSGAGTYEFDPAYPAGFGAQEFNVSGDLAIYIDGAGASAVDACESTSQDLHGKIALVADIFGCRFDIKAENAENAGAVGVVIVYNDGYATDEAFHMGGAKPITIPVLGVSDDDANPVINAMLAGDTVNFTMQLDRAPNRDGSLDTQVVAHEFFHYVSNRLVGDAMGLSNAQGGGMGEGWSDIAALLLTARADDLANNPDGYYAVGGYATGDYLYGVRVYPYVTGSPMTFADITSDPEAHFVGTVWATALWEAYIGLYKHYAAEDPTTAYVTAKTKMMNYLIESLMATPNSPTMIEARDALLVVAKATAQADYDIFIDAFAKHGMGFGAIAPPRFSTSLTGVVESNATELKAFTVLESSIDVNSEQVCDADYSLDPGETAVIKLTLLNTGNADLDGVTAQLSSDSDIVFADGGKVTFEPETLTMYGGTVTATTTARLDSATETGAPMAIKVSFPDVGKKKDSVQEPSPFEFHFTSNQDFNAAESVDDVENTVASLNDWTRTLTGNGAGWTVATSAGVNAFLGLPADNQFWVGPDNGSPTDVTLVTPPITVGDKAFSVSFYHYYQFEDGGYDGGVVEITTDGGKTWQDVTAAHGSFAFGYNGIIGPYNDYLNGRAGFINAGGTKYDGAPETVSFGTALAGKTVQLRFRVGSDPAGEELGWIIDDVTVEGATAPVFSVPVAENSYCGGEPPVANAGPDQTIGRGLGVKLDGSGSSDPEGSITFQWKQISGQPVELSDATAAAPTFTTPNSASKLRFELTVTDKGMQTDT
ncbi:MAG TPA: M36 family metallopeptidase, partial [Gammaproteobacteria bacterium]|nr:M36 family metallopeptidase [Gammaproteobacteria bacterium]